MEGRGRGPGAPGLRGLLEQVNFPTSVLWTFLICVWQKWIEDKTELISLYRTRWAWQAARMSRILDTGEERCFVISYWTSLNRKYFHFNLSNSVCSVTSGSPHSQEGNLDTEVCFDFELRLSLLMWKGAGFLVWMYIDQYCPSKFCGRLDQTLEIWSWGGTCLSPR